MKPENETLLRNIKDICDDIAKTENEDDVKSLLVSLWSWFAVRAIMGKSDRLEEIIIPVIEAIESAYEWDIPTMDEIERTVNRK